eukprot:SAG31_NODE_18697_length_626_cov_1.074004_1_plen_28_part_10
MRNRGMIMNEQHGDGKHINFMRASLKND